MMTQQEVFTKVVKHLRQQGRRALDSDGECCYRTGEGLKCAAGCLIADEFYRPELEGGNVHRPRNSDALAKSGVPHTALDLVRRLQLMHDYEAVEDWESQFQKLAREFALEVPR